MCEELISSSWEKNHMSNFSYTISIGQLGEQLTLNQWVLGSSPRWCTRKSLTENAGLFFVAIIRNAATVCAPSEDENSCGGDRRLRRKQGAGAGAAVAEAASRPRGAGRCGHRNP